MLPHRRMGNRVLTLLTSPLARRRLSDASPGIGRSYVKLGRYLLHVLPAMARAARSW